ncbi:MAG TPA: indolepyruvate ferredoxin oxidoreductase family protein [Alphaproteobacteria bacterium]|jgi:indolepyruvate ferredoxin oxidoreductase
MPDDHSATNRAFLTGSQALVRLLIEQALRDRAAGRTTAGYVSGYRGSPLGGLDQELARSAAELAAHGVKAQPGLNEELAATALWGTQQVGLFPGARQEGVFGLWYGKGPGVDRSGDAFKHANLAGTAPLGGVLAVAGDDHGAASSTTAHQSEYAFADAIIPVLAPAGVQEILDYGLMGLALSRFAGCWTALKLSADIAEGAASVTLERPLPILPADVALPAGGLHIRWPDRALDQEARLQGPKMLAAQAFVRANGLDRIGGAAKATHGIVASGKAWGDLRQALAGLGFDDAALNARGIRLYKVALVWPIEPETLLRFADGLDDILVVEEKRPLIEDQIKQTLYDHSERRPRVAGKSLLPASGELNAHLVARALARWLGLPQMAEASAPRAKPLLRRTPHYCSGCPHSRSTRVPEGSRALAGIGCHTMALWTDPNTQTLTQMGGEGATWIGQAPFTDTAHVFQNIGDGTFAHSGLLAVRAAIAAGVNITYKLLYNDAVAMTGGQAVEGALTVPRLARILEGEGVARIVVVAEEPDHYPKGERFPPGTTVMGRDGFDCAQDELRQVKGVSVLIFDQTCAAEKRRRRKRGTLAQAQRRAVINEQACEGCGDCATASNCLSVVPVETDWGRKRRVDQASCNADMSCLDGFCPSIVTVEGTPKPRKAAAVAPDETPLPPAPPLSALDKPFALLAVGIGGSGIVTLARVIARAAHESGLAVTLADQTGLAQKGGAVLSHLRIAKRAEDLGAARIGPADGGIDGADLILGGDLVVAASAEVLSRAKTGRAKAVVNGDAVITGAFLRDADKAFPADGLKAALDARLGVPAVAVFDSANAALRVGHAAGTNMALLGYAWQRGLLPLALDALRAAIAAEAPQPAANLAAFDAGRRAAHLAAEPAPPQAEALDSLDARIERHAAFLAAYQDVGLAARYRALVAEARAAETRIAPGKLEIAGAVARNYARLLAYKDEYEIARLLSAPGFHADLADQFEGPVRVAFHLAPSWLPRRAGPGGRAGKYAFGPWLRPVLRMLTALRFLRGTPFDPFARSGEHKLERALIAEYERTITHVLARLRPDTYGAAAEILRWPDAVRGFGVIKKTSADKARRHRDEMLATFDKTDRLASTMAAE